MRASSPRLAEQVADGHRVGGLAPAVQLQDRLVHELVGGPVVVERADHLHHVGDGVLGHQHPAEYALLGGQVVRRSTLELPAPGGEFGDAHDHPPPPSRGRLDEPRCRTSHPL